jgi:hypothetical protein
MKSLARAGFVLMIVGMVAFLASLIAESAIANQMHLIQFATHDSAGNLELVGKPFRALESEAIRMPGFGDQNAYLVDVSNRQSVLTEAQVKGIAFLAQAGALLTMLMGGLVVAISRSRGLVGPVPPT